jgi:hypothetical protein
VYPGETVTATLVAQVQASGSQFASAAACVLSGGGPIEDPDPSNNCAIGTVEINSPGTIPAGAPPPSGSTPVDQVVAPPVPTPSPAQQTVPQTTSPPAGSGATTSTAQVRAQLLSQLAPSGSAASIAALLRRRGYTFRWGAPGGGRLVIHWYDYLPMRARLSRVTLKPVIVAAGEASFAKAGVVKLTIKLTASGRRLLNKAKRLELTATATYTPSGAPAVTARRSFTLRR